MVDNTNQSWFIKQEWKRLTAWEVVHSVLLADRELTIDEIAEKTGVEPLAVAKTLERLKDCR